MGRYLLSRLIILTISCLATPIAWAWSSSEGSFYPQAPGSVYESSKDGLIQPTYPVTEEVQPECKTQAMKSAEDPDKDGDGIIDLCEQVAGFGNDPVSDVPQINPASGPIPVPVPVIDPLPDPDAEAPQVQVEPPVDIQPPVFDPAVPLCEEGKTWSEVDEACVDKFIASNGTDEFTLADPQGEDASFGGFKPDAFNLVNDFTPQQETGGCSLFAAAGASGATGALVPLWIVVSLGSLLALRVRGRRSARLVVLLIGGMVMTSSTVWASECTVTDGATLVSRVTLADTSPTDFFKQYPDCKDVDGRPVILVSGTIQLTNGIVLKGGGGIHLRGPAKIELPSNVKSTKCVIDLASANHVIEQLVIGFNLNATAGLCVSGAKNIIFKNTIVGYGAGIWLSNFTENTIKANLIDNGGFYGIYLVGQKDEPLAKELIECNLIKNKEDLATNWADSSLDECMQQGSEAQCKDWLNKCYLLWNGKELFPDLLAISDVAGASDEDDPIDGDLDDELGTGGSDTSDNSGTVTDASGCPAEAPFYDESSATCYADQDQDGLKDYVDHCPTIPDPTNACATTEKGVSGAVDGTGPNDAEIGYDGGGGCSVVKEAQLPGALYALLMVLVVTTALAISRQFRS